MKKSKLTQIQVNMLLKENVYGQSAGEVSRELCIDMSPFHYLRKKYGSMEVSLIERLKGLEVRTVISNRCTLA